MKTLEYLKYLARHKFFVLEAGLYIEAPLHRLVLHDLSKLLPDEWIPYLNHFYGIKDQYSFNRAWLKHQHRNDHHWQHWILQDDDGTRLLLDMPEEAIREMVADWCGAGRAINGRWTVRNWYDLNKNRLSLSKNTRVRVELLIDHFEKNKEKAFFVKYASIVLGANILHKIRNWRPFC